VIEPRRPPELIALVTGANRGIGRETARLLAEGGWHVLLGSRDAKRGWRVAADLAPHGSVEPLAIDVTDNASVAAAAANVADRHGLLDLLVNNAATFVGAPARDMTARQVDEVLSVNVVGVVRVIHAFLPLLERARRARIVNVSSTTASLGLTSAGADLPGDADVRLAYAASKAALNMLTLQYSRAFKRDDTLGHITVDSVSPGYAATAMNGYRAPCSAAEAGRIVVAVATRPGSEPGGGFLGDAGPIPW
jgi:NAD(P)-dependent dehydrogenase (short-subunit alcohol dehydrogenase family)